MKSSFGASRLSARRSSSGFTLIELMIVVAIIAILSAIAMYAYSGYIARGKRADARNQLMQAAQFMQQFYSANDSFSKDRTGATVVIPASLQQSPSGSTAIYTLSTPTTTAMTYTLTMTPVSPGSMAADSCGAFTLTSTGIRGILTSAGVGSDSQRDACWK